MTIVSENNEWRIRHLPGADFRQNPYTLDKRSGDGWELSVGYFSCLGEAISATTPRAERAGPP